MSGLDEMRAARMKKIDLLEAAGMKAYPGISHRTTSNHEFLAAFDDSTAQDAEDWLAGRIVSLRGQGGIIFVDIIDGTARVQVLLKKDAFDENMFKLFEDAVDAGDFIEAFGTKYTTSRGIKSLLAKEWRMLSKSLRPVPDQWFGLKDEDERYRKRYLDILLRGNADLFRRKAEFWNSMRTHMIERGFLEVETPTLEVTTGGAEARPFLTHHNDFDIDVYLRISVGELWQKRLMVAGFPRTFEIGRLYRNEGTSAEHLQEFTNLEFYAAYMDYKEGMAFTEDLIKSVAHETFGTMSFESKGFKFNLEGKWEVIEYVPSIERIAGINVLDASEDELKKKLAELGVQYTGDTSERMIDSLWKYCRKQIAGPAWLIDHPKLVSPLSKAKDDNSELVQRVQLILAGAEMTNGYSELNNPIDQRERFETQQALLERGDEEAMMPDWDFVEALEYGMPPAFGFGCGERLFATLANVSIREAQLFPLMRPKVSD
jgi:lysyl-tRNA synthetase, class II